MSKSKNHHYVPVHVQDAFAFNDKGQVNCFDKHTGRKFTTNPSNVLSETYFNEFDIKHEESEFRASFEASTSKLEAEYQPALKKIANGALLSSLDEEEYASLLLFISFQRIRTKAFRDQQEAMRLDVLKQITGKFPAETDFSHLKELKELSEEETKFSHIRMIREIVPKFMTDLVGRFPIIMDAPDGLEFLLGDNPVALSNQNDFGGLRGNLGWKCRGLEIYVPITPKRTLAILCPSIYDEISSEIKKSQSLLVEKAMKHARNHDPEFGEYREIAVEAIATASRFQKELENGHSEEISEDNVLYLNHLQVAWSSRFLISKSGDFSIAEQMISDNQEYKYPLGQNSSMGKRPNRPLSFPLD